MMFSAIQLLIILFALFAVTRVVIKVRSRSIPMTWATLWIIIWVGAGVVALLPQTTDLLAARVGIGRGADLLVYLSVMVLFYLIFRLVVKVESMQQDMTKLVRAISMKDLDNKKGEDSSE
ncbi:DUF2304 family protein [Candidatus Uhrbacteria bacterium]|jgi:small membrane protein|nr:DUF2304 family protein [Candidatus Uhrbacteria bacterium]